MGHDTLIHKGIWDNMDDNSDTPQKLSESTETAGSIASMERLIDELEGFRQGFRDAVNFAPGTAEDKKVSVFSMEAYHHQVDVMIVALGGESVREKQ